MDTIDPNLDVISKLGEYIIVRYKQDIHHFFSGEYYLWHTVCGGMSGRRNTCTVCLKQIPDDVRVALSLMPKSDPLDKVFRFAQLYGTSTGRLPYKQNILKGIKSS